MTISTTSRLAHSLPHPPRRLPEVSQRHEHPCCGFRRIRATTGDAHCRPPDPPASLSLFRRQA